MSFVILDDTDPRVQYEGSDWTATTAGAIDSWGIYGPTYNHTLHETHKDASLAFRFNGTSIGLYGTIDTANQSRPSWICTIDGKGTGRVDAPADQRINHWVLCEQPVEGFEEHLITLNVTVPEGATFRFDQVGYRPLQIVTEGEVSMVHENDAMVTYQKTSNWNNTGISYDTNIPGAALTLKFEGTAVEFYTILHPNLTASTGVYSIDGGPNATFTIPPHTGGTPLYNQALFSVTGLPPIEHSLTVAFSGKRNDTPLVLDYFFVSLPPPKELPIPNGGDLSPSLSSSGSDSAKSSGPVGAIVGGIVGGIAGLALIGLAVFFFIRRRNRRLFGIAPFFTRRELKLETPAHPMPVDAKSMFSPYNPGAIGSNSMTAFTNEQKGG